MRAGEKKLAATHDHRRSEKRASFRFERRSARGPEVIAATGHLRLSSVNGWATCTLD
jgi:hypothetical protein